MNASCYQYDDHGVCQLPYTGLDLPWVVVLGAALLLVGLYIFAMTHVGRALDEMEAADDAEG